MCSCIAPPLTVTIFITQKLKILKGKMKKLSIKSSYQFEIITIILSLNIIFGNIFIDNKITNNYTTA